MAKQQNTYIPNNLLILFLNTYFVQKLVDSSNEHFNSCREMVNQIVYAVEASPDATTDPKPLDSRTTGQLTPEEVKDALPSQPVYEGDPEELIRKDDLCTFVVHQMVQKSQFAEFSSIIQTTWVSVYPGRS